MSAATEQGSPGADPQPRDRIAAGYFPETSGGDPNRADAGPVHAIAAAQTRVLRLLVPASCRLIVRVWIAVIRTVPNLPAVQGASYSTEYAIHVDASPALPVVDATAPIVANADGAYVVAAVPGAGFVDFTFQGLAAEEYDVTASVQVFAARIR